MDAESAERERVTRELLELAEVPPEEVDWERTEDDEFLSYIALGDLARHLIVRKDQLSASVIPALFNRIESLLEVGTPNVRELIVVGFLETFQSNLLNDKLKLEAWETVLGPRTTRAWRGVDDYWTQRIRPSEFNRRVRSGFATDEHAGKPLRRWFEVVLARLRVR